MWVHATTCSNTTADPAPVRMGVDCQEIFYQIEVKVCGYPITIGTNSPAGFMNLEYGLNSGTFLIDLF
jgi:hypothetical protein